MATNNSVDSPLSGTTGSGNFVGSNSPSITTPKILTQINDVNNNAILALTPIGSAVNYLQIYNNSTGNNPVFIATGSDSSVSMQLQTKKGNFLLVDGTLTVAPKLLFYNAAQSNYTSLAAATSQATTLSLVLPAADAATAHLPLSSDGSGNLSFYASPYLGSAVFSSLQALNNGSPIYDNLGKPLLGLNTGGGTPVNYIQIANAASGGQPTISAVPAVGGDSNISLIIRGYGNGGVAIQGVTSGTSFASGYVGEIISNTVTYASATSYTSGNTTNLTSITLTSGNWDLWANIGITATTVTVLEGGISLVSGTLPAREFLTYNQSSGTNGLLNSCVPGIPLIVSGSSQTVYLVIFGTATGSAVMYGNLYARRRI
jgi:hypothetical protein